MVARCITLSFLLVLGGCITNYIKIKDTKREEPSRITYSGGDGGSNESAIHINGVLKPKEGIEAEYKYISNIHGPKGRAWRIVGQTMYHEEKKIFDVIEISLTSSSQHRIYYFDVTNLPWKRKGSR